jgi:RNA polymerase sigma factor (TIGR02999 family)
MEVFHNFIGRQCPLSHNTLLLLVIFKQKSLLAHLIFAYNLPMAKTQFTQIIKEGSAGKKTVLNMLIPAFYDELRRVAAAHMRREKSGHTLEPTALVNEALARMVGSDNVNIENRQHFLVMASQLMRRVLIDYARQKKAKKRPQITKVEFEALEKIYQTHSDVDLLVLDDALERLKALDVRKAQIIEMRFFGGFELEAIAETLKISLATVKRDFTFARAWLKSNLED